MSRVTYVILEFKFIEKSLQAPSWVQAIPEQEQLQARRVCQRSIISRFLQPKFSSRHLLLISVRE